MTNLLHFIVAIALLRVLVNGYKYILCHLYRSKYRQYLTDPEQAWQWVEVMHQVLELFKDAGIEDVSRSVVESTGYGYIKHTEGWLFDNLACQSEDIVGLVYVMFHRAMGVYRSRVLETFNPFYWIEVAINLPKRVLGYLGVSPESAVTRAIQLVYWAVALVTTFLYGLYKREIDQLVRGWISKLTP